MRYLSLDLETMGLAPQQPDRILQIAMVAEDTVTAKETKVEDLPYFTAIIMPEGEISGQITALAMNSWILVAIEMFKTKMKISEFKNRYAGLGIPKETLDRAHDAFLTNQIGTIDHIVERANIWITSQFGAKDHINIAGKNVAGFDMPFLPYDLKKRFRHRCIDPGSIFVDWNLDRLPSSEDIAKKLGIQSVSHDALGDARDVIRALRFKY